MSALLALEARCVKCGHLFAAIGENMNRAMKEHRNFSIAVCLLLEIEDYDQRIVFEDADLEHIGCLNDIVELTARKLAMESTSGCYSAAAEIVQRAVARVFPGCSPCGDLPLDDAFEDQPRSDICRWHGRNPAQRLD